MKFLISGKRVAILAGQSCLAAYRELERPADTLATSVAKVFVGKALLPDGDPLTTGGIEHLGNRPSLEAMQAGNTLLILGSIMSWTDQPCQARGVQIDRQGDRIGLRCPVEIGLVGGMCITLTQLQPLLRRQMDRRLLAAVQTGMRNWQITRDGGSIGCSLTPVVSTDWLNAKSNGNHPIIVASVVRGYHRVEEP